MWNICIFHSYNLVIIFSGFSILGSKCFSKHSWTHSENRGIIKLNHLKDKPLSRNISATIWYSYCYFLRTMSPPITFKKSIVFRVNPLPLPVLDCNCSSYHLWENTWPLPLKYICGIKYKLFLCSVYASSSIFYSIRFYSYSYLTIIHSFYLWKQQRRQNKSVAASCIGLRVLFLLFLSK